MATFNAQADVWVHEDANGVAHFASERIDDRYVLFYRSPGRHIVEFEQAGEARATYGKKLLPRLADILSREFGKGFDDRNLRNMRAFYLTFPIWNAVRTELSWTHYRNLLRVSNPQARQWYMNEATTQNWSSRALDRQIDTLYYERLLLSGDKVSAKV